MIPAPLDAVIFDMDGLLLDTETLWRETMFAVGGRMGRPVSNDLFSRIVGHPREESDAMLMAHFGADFPLSEFHEHCTAHWSGLCAETVPLRPGARELLEALARAGVPRAIATSTRREAAVSHLRKAGIHHLLDAVVTRSDVARGKPHPDTFLMAAHRLGARPAHCLALEDSHNGVRAAHAAGMSTVMVPDTLPATDEMRRLCAAVVDSLHDVRCAVLGVRGG